jgi:hypothetical protein
MTQEAQDALIGRTLRELRDVRETLAKLVAKVRGLGNDFSAVGQDLQTQPSYLRFDGEAVEARFGSGRQRCQLQIWS